MTTPRYDSTRPEAQTIGLQDVLRFLRRGALLAVLTGLAAGAVAFVLTDNAAPQYRATVTLLASTTNSGYARLDLVVPPPVDPAVYQTAILEGPVAGNALASVLGDAPSQQQVLNFRKHIDVQVQKQDISSVLRISFDSADPKYAAAAANAISGALINWDIGRTNQTVERGIEALKQSIASLDAQLKSGQANGQALTAGERQSLSSLLQQRQKELDTALARSQSSVSVGLLEPLSAADVPNEPVGPSASFRTLVAFLVGALLAYGLLFLRWALDPRVRSPHELVGLTGVPILAEFPAPSRSGQDPSIEAANFLRSSIMAIEGGNQPIVLGMTTLNDMTDMDGVSTSLAASLARAGYRTLLVDADLRRNSTTYGLDISQVSSAPLEVYLENPRLEFAPVRIPVAGKQGFDFVPSFTEAQYPVELLSRGLWTWLESWRDVYDVILVDCPPLLPYADAMTVAPMCSGLVYCSNPARTVRSELVEAVTRLRQNGIRVVGAILTNVRVPAMAAGRARRPRAGVAPAMAREDTDPYKTLSQEAANVRVKER